MRHFHRLTGPRLAAACLAASVLGLIAWPGCTVTKDNYKTLSFFFDGVPDPSAPGNTVDPLTGEIRAAVMVAHDPFAKEQCDECHKGKLRMSRNDSAPCLRCHADQPNAHKYMHGPVAAGACLWCHNPHESAQPHLMRDSDRKVCGQCHTKEFFEGSSVEAHLDAARACQECHTGHGSDSRFMLRPGADASTPAPGDQPTPTPDSQPDAQPAGEK
jgi:predicted CXXCH cytochrome family protein